jgi:sulfatase maturation enzyme AslB (radical SAM superfamily)
VGLGPKEAIFFHSLFGTSLILNREAEDLLDLFRTPITAAQALTASARGNLKGPLDLLVQKRLLVHPGADEREEFVRRMRPHPPETGAHLRQLVLLAAEQCNLACPYCIKDRLMDLRPGRPQTRMKMETALQAIDAFLALAARAGQTDLGLQFRGGESLVNAAVVFGATRYMRSSWTRGPVAVSMVTNATLVTDAIAREMAALKISAEVSIDGTRAIHDSVRFTKGGRPTFDAVLAGLDRLRDAGVEVTNVNATVTAETLPHIGPSFFSMLGRMGVRLLNLEPDVLRPVHPDPRAVAERLLALRAQGRAAAIEVSGCWARPVRAIGEVRRGASLPPQADYALLVVDALGQVVRWEYNPEAELGPVADLPAVLASTRFQSHVESRTPGQIPECRGCEIEGICQGNATFALLYERATGRPGLFQHRCELLRAMTRGVLAENDKKKCARPTPLSLRRTGSSLSAPQ